MAVRLGHGRDDDQLSVCDRFPFSQHPLGLPSLQLTPLPFLWGWACPGGGSSFPSVPAEQPGTKASTVCGGQACIPGLAGSTSLPEKDMGAAQIPRGRGLWEASTSHALAPLAKEIAQDGPGAQG